MYLKDILREMNFKGHVVIHLWQNGYWCPIGGGTADVVARRYGYLEACDSRIVDGILIFRCM